MTGAPTAASVDDPTRAAGRSHRRLQMLDGWRAISILLVMAAHMLPLGPRAWAMNEPVAANGMAIFFTLSGFLIVSILLRDDDVPAFLIRRVARIVPLAWAVLVVAFAIRGVEPARWSANLLFYANLPPFWLVDWTSHFWSLSVEMQFYAAIALVVGIGGQRALWLVPVAALAVTLLRIATGTPVSIVTWLRVDEILSGGTLALFIHGDPNGAPVRFLRRLPFWPFLLLFALSTRPELPVLNYVRPYLAATLVGITILRTVQWVSPVLECRPLGYIAKISYALYIFHQLTLFGWLNSGSSIVRYAKRPISFAITFGLAHLSTFYFEGPINRWGHRVAARRKVGVVAAQSG